MAQQATGVQSKVEATTQQKLRSWKDIDTVSVATKVEDKFSRLSSSVRVI